MSYVQHPFGASLSRGDGGAVDAPVGSRIASDAARRARFAAGTLEPEPDTAEQVATVTGRTDPDRDAGDTHGVQHDEDCCTGNGCECFERRRLARLRSWQTER